MLDRPTTGTIRALAAFAPLVCVLAQEPGAPPVLQVDEVVEAELTDADPVVEAALFEDNPIPVVGKRYRVAVGAPGTYHVELLSDHFDAFLILRDGTGAVVASDDDGLFGLNSRLVVELEPGDPATLEACSLYAQRGPFQLVLRSGKPEAIPPAERAALDLDYARRHLATVEQAMGPDHPGTFASLNNLAGQLRDRGDLAGARPLLERAAGIAEGFEEPGLRPRFPQALKDLADCLVYLGAYEQALETYERALAAHEEVHGTEDPAAAQTCNSLALLFERQAEYELAQSLHERALEVRERTLGPDHPDTAQSLNNLASLLQRLGDHGAARPLFERALAIQEGLDAGSNATAAALHNLGSLLQELGEHEAARELYERGLAIKQANLGPDHAWTATSLDSLASLLKEQGDLVAARPLFERALAIREKAAGAGHPDTARSLANLAGLLRELGEAEAARPLAGRALAISEKVLGPDHPWTARNRGLLADLLHEAGELDTALVQAERALACSEEVLGPEHPQTSRIRNRAALVLLDLGRPAEAAALMRKGREGTRRHRGILASLSEGERYAYLATVAWKLEVELAIAEHLEGSAERTHAYESLLAWKGQVARLVFSSHRRLATETTPAQRELVHRLRVEQRLLSGMAFRFEEQDPTVLERMRASRLERNRLEVELARTLGEGRGGAGSAGFAQVRAGLPEGGALVDLLVHRRREPAPREESEPAAAGHWTEPHVSAWITKAASAEPVRVDLGPAAALEEAVRGFLEDLVVRRGHAVTESDVPTWEEELRALLWDPLAEQLEDVETVFVSPDGFLGTLPLETLALADGSMLLEHHAFVYLQDASGLAHRDTAPAAKLDSMLVVGGVDFNARADLPAEREPDPELVADAENRGGFSRRWGPLSGTVEESDTLSDLFEHEVGGKALLLQGSEPTEERLREELPRHRVLHLATHGFFNPAGLPSLWEAALTDAEVAAEQRSLIGSVPGLLSGIVCAGANEPVEGRADGYLTADDVGWMDLDGVELVVLSACETGLGLAQAGEGLMSLRRAFLTAGARTVISSLWSVKDESTTQLMSDFYLNLFERGMGRLEALRAAQLRMLNLNRAAHGEALPSTWGAFVLGGAWE